MFLKSTQPAKVFVDVRSRGIVAALDHALRFHADVASFAFACALSENSAKDLPIEAQIAVNQIAPPADASRSDRAKMLENLRSREVLDAVRFPEIAFRGRYRGTLDAGELSGELLVRGAPRKVTFAVRGGRSEEALSVEATWEGALTALGVRPYRALLGALKLDDWVRIRIESVFQISTGEAPSMSGIEVD